MYIIAVYIIEILRLRTDLIMIVNLIMRPLQVALLRNSIKLALKELKDWMAPDKV